RCRLRLFGGRNRSFIGVVAVVWVAAAMTLVAGPSAGGGFPFQELDRFEFLKSGDPLTDWAAEREWVSADGRKLTARVVELRGTDCDFVLPGGKLVKIELSKLSERDRQFLHEWNEIRQFFDTNYTPPRDLSGKVKAAMFDGVFAKEGPVHETRHFRFECDEPLRATIAKDFSRLFEVTHTAVAKLPLGLSLDRPGGEKILVRLFSERGDYLDAGGKKDAAGVYLLKERVVLVPLASLGIERSDNGKFRKTRDFDPATLIHETTHAVMNQWLEHMPLWLSEGLAEYVAALPYRDGELDFSKHESGLLRLAAKKFGGEAERFELLEPPSFVHLDPGAFMGEPGMGERPINLPVVRPYQIELVKPGAPTKPAASAAVSVEASTITAIKPLMAKPDPTVVRRYVSSMLLVQHLMESDPAEVRKFLFALLHGGWSRSKYLVEWNRVLGIHNDAVEAQISSFGAEWAGFISDVASFNAAVARHNAGQIVRVPKRPVVPVPPKPVPVPQILASPKKASELSRKEMRKQATGEYLKLPGKVLLPGKG
ncbi:MAG: hypothetical protein ACR2RV_20270, partial [Verrucomicrobiales bacterium]